MTSQAKIAANRANGEKSRGPRTAIGKSRASRNALRHGLAAITRHNPAHFPAMQRIARAYCEGDTDHRLFEAAMLIAENDVILTWVNVRWSEAIERMRDPDATPFSDIKASLARARATFAQAQLAYGHLVETKARPAVAESGSGHAVDPRRKSSPAITASIDAAASRSATVADERHPPARCDELEAMLRAEPDLRRLERYRRRATSRRNRGIREFIFMRSLRESQRRLRGKEEVREMLAQQEASASPESPASAAWDSSR